MRKMIKENINFKIKKDKTYITYTIMFGVISFFVFGVFIIYNKSFVWEGDGIKQHFTILYDFNQIVRNMFQNGIPMLSWNMGLGLDVIGQYSYYVIGDPFAYISLLFPMDNIELAYNFLVLLRIYCVGLAFIAYCKYTKKEKFNTILGATIYAFCGFILYAGVRHPYFTNAAIFLPLTLLGIEKLLQENQKVFLTFIIFLSTLSNYYFFYMITVISVIYGVIKYIFEYNKGIKVFFKKIGSAVLCYIIGILMASIIFLPTVYAFLCSTRTGTEQATTYISGYYKYLFMGVVSLRFKNWSAIGVSSIVILMLPILLTKLKDKEARSYLSLFIITTIMLLLPQVASLMNGFSFPSNRWVFVYCFILAYIVTLCFDIKLKYTKKQKIIMFVTLIGYSIIGAFLTKLKIKKNLDYYAIGVLAYLIFTILCLNYKKEKNIKVAKSMIMILVISNIFVISASLYFPQAKGYVEEFIQSGTVEENCASVNGKIENFKEAIEYIKANDNGFYRITKKDTTYENLSIIYDYNPTQLYFSLGNGNVYNLSCSLEDNCHSHTKCVNGGDRRTKFTTLLSNKYFVCNKEDSRYVPYGYTLYHKIEDTLIYINENHLPVGVVYNSYITKEQFDNLSPLERADSLITTAMIEDKTKVNINENSNIKIDKPINLNYKVKNNKIIDNIINITENNESIELIIDDIPENYEIYLSIKNLEFDSGNERTDFKITANIDGITNSEKVNDFISSAYYMRNTDFLINLGITQNNQDNSLKLTFNKKGIYTFDNLQILAISMGKYEKKIKSLSSNVLQNISYADNYISGKINSESNGILQITTSYSDGWKAYIDGKETEVFKVNEAFIGINVEKGEHTIEFKYETPFFKLGAMFSLLGILGFIAIIFIDKRK